MCVRINHTELIRKHQIKGGYEDCFARGYEDCTEEECLYRLACQKAHIQEWQGTVIDGSGDGKIYPIF